MALLSWQDFILPPYSLFWCPIGNSWTSLEMNLTVTPLFFSMLPSIDRKKISVPSCPPLHPCQFCRWGVFFSFVYLTLHMYITYLYYSSILFTKNEFYIEKFLLITSIVFSGNYCWESGRVWCGSTFICIQSSTWRSMQCIRCLFRAKRSWTRGCCPGEPN